MLGCPTPREDSGRHGNGFDCARKAPTAPEASRRTSNGRGYAGRFPTGLENPSRCPTMLESARSPWSVL
ncbi:unnamed protein product, partial [Citrullus colocynthis]